jgi:hypothetical protein
MKTKRNKQVVRKRQLRASWISREGRSITGYLRIFGGGRRRGRKPKSLLTLLEQDALVQTERLQRLESAFLVTLTQPELVPVAVTETQEAEATTEEQPITRSPENGRTNYQFIASSKRVRRRIVI